MPQELRRCLLAVMAHPDDETFGCGGTLARYAAEGVHVALICATRGEAGEISDAALATPEDLPQVRENELRAACHVLGVKELHMLGYRDSGMAGTPENHHPQALMQSDRAAVVDKIVEIIRKVRPQVIVTFDPNGGYGHPDHIAIHEATRDAFAAAGDGSGTLKDPADTLEPHNPAKLYYFVFPRSLGRAMREAFKESGIKSDFADMDPEALGVPDEEITTVLDVSQYKEQKDQAGLCHRTQIQDVGAFSWLPDSVRTRYMSTEHMIRAEPPFTPVDDTPEDDLFRDL